VRLFIYPVEARQLESLCGPLKASTSLMEQRLANIITHASMVVAC